MAKVSAKSSVITINSQICSSDVMSYDIEQDAGKIDITGFGDGSVNYIPGLPVYGLTMDVKWNTAATTGMWTLLKAMWLAASGTTITIVPEVGGPTFSGVFMLDALPVSATPGSAINVGSVHFSIQGTAAATFAS
jgi:hypothetical protein